MGRDWSKGKEYVPRHICVECGKEFYCAPCILKRGPERGKTCSRSCSMIYQYKQKGEYPRPIRPRLNKYGNPQMPKIKKLPSNSCLTCGKTCYRIYCTRSCYGADRTKKTIKIMRSCITCGKEMIVPKGVANTGNGYYCSSSCASINRVKNAKHKTYGNSKGGKRPDLNDRYFRSRWEANYARYLNVLISLGELIKWEYEVDTFYFTGIKRGIMSYTPDFKLFYPDGREVYVEIKGYLDDKSKTKLKRMAKYYPDKKVDLFGSDRYKDLHKKMSAIIPHWETDEKKKSIFK